MHHNHLLQFFSQVALAIAIVGILGSIYNLIKVSQRRALVKETGEHVFYNSLSNADYLFPLMLSSFLAVGVLFLSPFERPIDIHLPIGVNEVLLDSNNIYQQDEYFKVAPKDTAVRDGGYVDVSKRAVTALQLAMSENGEPSILKINDNYKTVEYIVDVETRGLLVDYKIKTYKLRFHNNSGPTTQLPDLENLPVVE